jgi:homoserine kinase
MPPYRVTVKAPATTANLGPGFDVFGLALEQPSDKVTIISIPEGVKIEVTGLSAATIPVAPEKNTAGVVANQMLKEFSLKAGVLIKIEKGIVPGMGLGSSAASAAAVAYGLNRMLDLKLDNKQLIRLAAKGEVASAGSEHADNVSAAICGDFVIIKSYNPLEIVNLKAPADMEVCVAFPHMVTPANKTEKARSVVPKLVPLDKVTHNVGRAAAMASGFATGDVDLIGGSMSDAVVEPARAFLIPGYEQVKENALKAGACGVAVSGAGPAMISIVNKKKADASKIAGAMKAGFESAGLNATAFATRPGEGVRLLELE